MRTLLLRHKKRAAQGNLSRTLRAEGAGFEPAVQGYCTTVFKTVTFGRSVNPPYDPKAISSPSPATELRPRYPGHALNSPGKFSAMQALG